MKSTKGYQRWLPVLISMTLVWSVCWVSCSNNTNTTNPPAPSEPQTGQQPGTAPTPVSSPEPTPEATTQPTTQPMPLPSASPIIATPSPSPSAQPSSSPSPSPTETVTWSIVTEKKDCPYPLCKGRGLFWIDNSGHYFQEPEQDSQDGDGGDDFRFPHSSRPQGHITPSERVELIAVADVVADQYFSPWLSCSPISPMPGQSSVILQMWFTNWTLQTIYKVDVQNAKTCHAGSLAKALALYHVLDSLVEKYYILPGTYEPCATKSCGVECTVCNPSDPLCEETAVLKHCDSQKKCMQGHVTCP